MSKLLLRCRNEKDDARTGGLTDFQDKSQGEPVYCLGGIRHKGSANLIRAFVRNVGTCRSDAKGEIQVEETTRMRVPMRDTGADHPVVVLKFL